MSEISASFLEALSREQAFQELTLVSVQAYEKSIECLVSCAVGSGGQSEVAAQILLCLHNGYEFHCSIPELGMLDAEIFHSALIAIRGRITLRQEPHEVVNDGRRRLAELCERWKYLHVSKRYAKHY